MKKFITTLHRWLGFPLGLLFIITFGTGCLTSVDELLERLQQSQTRADFVYRTTTPAEDAQALSLITEGKKSIRQVMLPSKEAPYYQLVARGERWLYPIDQLDQQTHIKTNNDGFFGTVLQLHRNFLLGKEGFLGVSGKLYVTWVGLIALLISLLGLWMWWPLRKSFKAKDILPRGKKRKHFYYSHMTSGVVVLAVILLMSLTGASITYRAFTQSLLGVERDAVSSFKAVSLNNDWSSWLQAAYAQMPAGAQLQQIRFPRQQRSSQQKNSGQAPAAQTNRNERRVLGANVGNNGFQNNSLQSSRAQDKGAATARQGKASPQLLEFRFKAAGDWLGLAGSKVKIDKQSSRLVDATLFRDLALGEKVYAMLVPLHTGHNLPALYVLALLLLSVVGTVMVLSGLVSFVIKKRKGLKFSSVFPLKTARP